jgi:hypothetical protein
MEPMRALAAALLLSLHAAGLALGLWLFCSGARRLPRPEGWVVHIVGGGLAVLFAAWLVTAILVVFFGVRLEG